MPECKMREFAKHLARLAPETTLLLDEAMSRHTTFAIGGPADIYAIPTSIQDVCMIVSECNAQGVRLRTIGKGSDLLVCDEGLDGLVMEIGAPLGHIKQKGELLIVGAGATNEQVSDYALAASLSGYEFACGIPGTIGGAAIMNAGAYGGEFAQVCESLLCVDTQGKLCEVSREQAQWGYRKSMMNDRSYIVLEARLRLAHKDKHDIKATIDDLSARRNAKQPLSMPSAGSTFKRPEGHYAGKLIQDAGLRGYSIGGAQVSTLHSGFIINAQGATSQDVCALIAKVQEVVYDQFEVRLEPEVRIWNRND